MKNIYVFPAIYNCTSKDISIIFSDLPRCLKCADDYTETSDFDFSKED